MRKAAFAETSAQPLAGSERDGDRIEAMVAFAGCTWEQRQRMTMSITL
jgi:hypothetical protein